MIPLPRLCLVALIGPSGSGKSTFARRHFLPTEVLSSDAFRAAVSDDENDQSATPEAFAALHAVAAARLRLGRLAVIDATSVRPEDRRPLVELARAHHCLPVAIVLNVPEKVCHERNRSRTDRALGPHVVRNQTVALKKSLRHLRAEGFRHVFVLDTPDEIDAVTIERVPLYNDRRDDRGPFDIIGDVHGCFDELADLLGQLGYERSPTEPDPLWGDVAFAHPQGRKAVFLGDLMDRGPRNLDTVRLVRNMVRDGSALCVPGNHDVKLLRKLRGKNVKVAHGLAETLAELDALPDEFRKPFASRLADFLDGLVSHYVLDGGNLVVAHAGMKQEMQGRASGAVRDFALYGETTGETDEFGLPVRHDWAADYRGPATVVYGHTPVVEPEWLNRTIDIDTGCVFGGRLTALRWPERELVSVDAARTYCEPIRPLRPISVPTLSAQQANDDLLDLADVRGKRHISTRLAGTVTIREDNAAAALEVMSRFAVDPKWLIHLPPTMSPPETAAAPGLLEHPAEAFAYFRAQGVPRVICEEKHMGSRAVVVVCRDEEAARTRFGVDDGSTGVIVTRTGRPFFNDDATTRAALERVRTAFATSGMWDALGTTWAVLDAELMPWSAKALELLRHQYAAVGSAATTATPRAAEMLARAVARMPADEGLSKTLAAFRSRTENAAAFVASYRRYCRRVETIDDLRLAPFHLLATEGAVYADKPHAWHLSHLDALADAGGGFLQRTNRLFVDLADETSVNSGIKWWQALTDAGGEGMVVKPESFLHDGGRGRVQPAVKCRGREYLRIIYGPDYTDEANLKRLRSRSVMRKRSLAWTEFALGLEALERFVRGEPLRRVHECVFGVLALESEGVDPRL